MKVKDVIKSFEQNGWQLVRTKGKRYVVILEKGKENFGAYVPDLPGCVAVAETKKEVTKLIKEAIEFHLEGYVRKG